MKNYFDITEFLIDPDMRESDGLIPVHVVQKIDKYHKPILNPVRKELGCPVIISKNSGYRPVRWEISKGRDGSSEHTFGDGKTEIMDYWGAVDVTCKQMRFFNLLQLLKDSEYRRVCYYVHDQFVHCDFKGFDKVYYTADENGTWTFKGNR